MAWNRTGSTLMQATGEYRLSEPLSTALVEAARRGDKSDVFKLIYQGSWVEQRDASAFTALLRAADQGAIEMVKRLLKVGADFEAKNLVRRRHATATPPPRQGQGAMAAPTPVYHAYATHMPGSIGAGPNTPAHTLRGSTQHGNTALMLAAEKNRFHVAAARSKCPPWQ